MYKYFKCPKTHKSFENETEAKKYFEQEFPITDGIPWIFKNSEAHMLYWQGKTRSSIENWFQKAQSIHRELQEPGIDSLTKTRLNSLLQSYKEQIEYVTELLDPIVDDTSSTSVTQAINANLPTIQSLELYFDNVFRDWVWGESENSIYQSLLAKIENLEDPNIIAILGGGTGRLGYEFAKNWKNSTVLNVDINPLLMFAGRKALNQKPYQLFEWPLAPLEIENFCVKHKVQFDQPIPENLHFVFSDIMNLPLQNKIVDLAVTPWVIDVIPQPFNEFCQRVNVSLSPHGKWLNFGPLGFGFRQHSRCLSAQEVKNVVESHGFKIETFDFIETPYLQSPHSGQKRTEKILFFIAQKTKEAKEPREFQYFPHWLSQTKKSISEVELFKNMAMTNGVHLEILSQIDGKTSLEDISETMTKKFGLTPQAAKESLFHFLSKCYESQKLYK